MTNDEWMDDLRGWAGGVRPVGDVVTPVQQGVRRRRRVRAGLAAGGAAALVAATAVGVAAIPQPGTDRDAPPPAAASSTAPVPEPAGFTCGDNPVFGDPPPLANLAAQQQVVQRLREMSSVQVVHAEPTALGVVALVADDSGDQDSWADPAVVEQLRGAGASVVYEWDPAIADADVDAAGRVQQVLQWEIDPAARAVRRAVRGIPGDAGLAMWQEAGAVLVQWKAPVPPEVAALDGTRPDGVRVIVEEVAYSDADTRRAQQRLQGWLRETGTRDDWASSYACGDGTGLVVGMVPPLDDAAALGEEIAAAVGMPVHVVPEERPVDLLPVAPAG